MGLASSRRLQRPANEHDPRDEFALRLLDSMIYRTLAHLQWIILVLLFVVLGIKGG